MSGVHRAELADAPRARVVVEPKAEEKKPRRRSSAKKEPPVAGEAVELAPSGDTSSSRAARPEAVVVPVADEREAVREEEKEEKKGGDGDPRADEERGDDGTATKKKEETRARTPEEILGLEDKPFSCKRWCEEAATLSNFTNIFAFLLFIAGVLLEVNDSTKGEVSKYVLSAGLFGFAGSITNAAAVKMLFDRVPFLYGSGVIPNRFVSIRLAMKNTIMAIFFDEHYMEKYMAERVTGFMKAFDMKSKVQEMMTDPRLDDVILKNLEGTAKQPGGAILVPVAAMLGGYAKLVPMVKPLLGAFATEMVNQVQDGTIVEDNLDVKGVRREIESFMDEKIKVVTPQLVKKMMEDVMRKHLGMLVVWGFVFGAGLGVISTAVGYGS